MIVRLVFGLGWSLATGVAGVWLALAPWSLGGQGGGDWTTVTRSQLGAGVGLIVLAVAGVVVVGVQVAASLREAGLIAPGRARTRAADGAASSPEMEKALIALAQALADDLEAQRSAEPDARAVAEPSAGAGWREPR